MGRLRVVATPDASVYIDGSEVGGSPYEASLKPGEYTVKLMAKDKKTAATSWQAVVQVNENTLTYVNRELAASDLIAAGEVFTLSPREKKDGNTGDLIIESDPPGAVVYLDNDQKGIAPLLVESVPSEDHEISLYMPGFFRRSLKIKIEEDHVLQAKVKLALDQAYKTLTQALEQEEKQRASQEAQLKVTTEPKLKILETPTGFLNVRSAPGVGGQILTTVDPGEEFIFTEEKNGWYKITADGKEGWVSGEYISKL